MHMVVQYSRSVNSAADAGYHASSVASQTEGASAASLQPASTVYYACVVVGLVMHVVQVSADMA